MFKKNRKLMFFVMLTPFYLLIWICLLGMSMGGVDWLGAAISSLLIIIASWALSRKRSLLINAPGLLIFAGMGLYLIITTLARTVRTGPWTLNIYGGVALIVWGLAAFVYDIVRRKAEKKSGD